MLIFAAAAPDPALSLQGGFIAQFLPLLIMLVVFYLFLLRPQQQQQKRRQEMLAKLKRGDKILTVGGLYGEIVAMREDILTVRLADNVEVRVTRNGVAQVV
jgi:preprotein translocase subunit YajC